MIKHRVGDLFKPKDEKELEESMRNAELSFQIAGDRARACLSTDQFKAYKEAFLQVQIQLMDALTEYNKNFHKNPSGDAVKYGMTVSYMLTRLEVLRSLVGLVQRDSLKGLKQNGKQQPSGHAADGE